MGVQFLLAAGSVSSIPKANAGNFFETRFEDLTWHRNPSAAPPFCREQFWILGLEVSFTVARKHNSHGITPGSEKVNLVTANYLCLNLFAFQTITQLYLKNYLFAEP